MLAITTQSQRGRGLRGGGIDPLVHPHLTPPPSKGEELSIWMSSNFKYFCLDIMIGRGFSLLSDLIKGPIEKKSPFLYFSERFKMVEAKLYLEDIVNSLAYE